MAPIRDETVDALKDLVHKLEARVEQLESKLHQGSPNSAAPRSSAGDLRLILIGPPGAGKFLLVPYRSLEQSQADGEM